MPEQDRPIKRRQRMPASRLEALRREAVAGRNVRPGTNTFGIQTGAGASHFSKDTLPELIEVKAIAVVDEWEANLPAPFLVGNLTKVTDAVTGAVLYYRCNIAHNSNGVNKPGTLGGAAHWTLVYTPYSVYILDCQSGAQVHEFSPVFIDDGGFEVPQFTKGYMGTDFAGDKFMLTHTTEGQWYMFSNSDISVASSNFWLGPSVNHGLFGVAAAPPFAHAREFLPECRAGYITEIRASWTHYVPAAAAITAGQIELWPVRTPLADTRNGGTNTYNLLAGSFSLILDPTHHTNSSTAHAAVVQAGDGIGILAQTDAAYADSGVGYARVECWIKMVHSG